MTAPTASVVVLTAFTDDYELGHVCAPVNGAYARRHGYRFVCRTRPPDLRETDEMSNSCRHPTWDKVALILELLDELLDAHNTHAPATFLLWIDADAVVVDQEKTVEQLLREHAPSCDVDLLIGEDVTRACLVNAGVLLVIVYAPPRDLAATLLFHAISPRSTYVTSLWPSCVLRCASRSGAVGCGTTSGAPQGRHDTT